MAHGGGGGGEQKLRVLVSVRHGQIDTKSEGTNIQRHRDTETRRHRHRHAETQRHGDTETPLRRKQAETDRAVWIITIFQTQCQQAREASAGGGRYARAIRSEARDQD